ncbi:MAG: hypothetical protein V4463_23345 [Pseudomonadota bacterium]
MDKDLLKGLAIFFGVIVALVLLFFVVSEAGPDQAKCIANALKNGIPYANIDKTCNLTKKAY